MLCKLYEWIASLSKTSLLHRTTTLGSKPREHYEIVYIDFWLTEEIIKCGVLELVPLDFVPSRPSFTGSSVTQVA